MDALSNNVLQILRNNAQLSRIVPESAIVQHGRWVSNKNFRSVEPDQPWQSIFPDESRNALQKPRKRRKVERMVDLKEYNCRICLEEISRTQASILIPCLHRFCFTCIRRWFRVRPSCALCHSKTELVLYSIRTCTDYKLYKVKDREKSLARAIDLSPTPCCSGEVGDRKQPIHDHSLKSPTCKRQLEKSTRIISTFVSADGSIWCDTVETNRLRASLGLRVLDYDRKPLLEHSSKFRETQEISVFSSKSSLDAASQSKPCDTTDETNKLETVLGLTDAAAPSDSTGDSAPSPAALPVASNCGDKPPSFRVQVNHSTGEVWCSILETDRIRHFLGLSPLSF